MLILLISCLSAKVTGIEQELRKLQQENTVLEAKVERLEKKVQEMEEPVQAMSTFMSIINKDLQKTEQDSSEETSKERALKIAERSDKARKEHLVVSQKLLLECDKETSKKIRPIRYFDANDVFEGYRVTAIRRSSRAYAMGLKNGDILIAINGQPSTEMLMELVLAEPLTKKRLSNNQDLQILLKRRNADLLLTITLED